MLVPFLGRIAGYKLVGTGGFEPPAPCSQGRCADQTALRPEYFSVESLKVGDLVSQGRGVMQDEKNIADLGLRIEKRRDREN